MPTDELKVFDLTLPTPAANLACDEALLDWCEASGFEVLRFWEPGGARVSNPPEGLGTTRAGWKPARQSAPQAGVPAPSPLPSGGSPGGTGGSPVLPCFVVLGHGNRVAAEVNQEACAEAGVGIYRRCSGGGAVVQGPGCLNYALVLRIPETGPLAGIAGANRWIMERHRGMIEGLLRREKTSDGSLSPHPMGEGNDARGHNEAGWKPALHSALVEVRGHTDLAWAGRKFSGNAQRRARRALLFHGTFLCGLDLSLVGRFLQFPSRPPDYRQDRSHESFLVNLPLRTAKLKQALQNLWGADQPLTEWPERETERLAREKYETWTWRLKY